MRMFVFLGGITRSSKQFVMLAVGPPSIKMLNESEWKIAQWAMGGPALSLQYASWLLGVGSPHSDRTKSQQCSGTAARGGFAMSRPEEVDFEQKEIHGCFRAENAQSFASIFWRASAALRNGKKTN
jgi:hypothetical protein